MKRHVQHAIDAVNPERYRQEPPYTAALANRLEGVVYEDDDAHVEFSSTVVDDRGRDAAEGWSGADLAITASISDRSTEIKKAILVQAKLGAIGELDAEERDRLNQQIRDMKQLTRSPKVMEIATTENQRQPRMISGNRLLENHRYRPMKLGDYFVARVLTTLDGDTRPGFVAGVQDSPLTKLKVLALLRV